MNIMTLSDFGPIFLKMMLAGTPQTTYAIVKTYGGRVTNGQHDSSAINPSWGHAP